jgi:hypothetical protein
MRLKDSFVNLKDVSWRMFYAAISVEKICEEFGVPCVITSANDGKHSDDPLSLHYDGLALDFRTRDITADRHEAFAERVRGALPPDYYVRLESDHLHIQYKHRNTLLTGDLPKGDGT